MTASMPPPFDVKLMNLAASAMFALCAFMAVAAGFWWAWRHPAFAIGAITVQGDVAHNNAVTLRANVAPRLAGNFFTVDLGATRKAFEAAPWVRKALVRREFPNRLRVVLQEHQPVAHWGPEGESKLVNSFGEVFEANAGDVEQQDLPRLSGPDDQAAQVLAVYRAIKPLFEPLDMAVDQVALSGRGGWSTELDNGAQVELGRGTAEEVAARTQVFVRTLAQVAAKYSRSADALVSADLRHSDGYALRLRGVSTTSAEAKK